MCSGLGTKQWNLALSGLDLDRCQQWAKIIETDNRKKKDRRTHWQHNSLWGRRIMVIIIIMWPDYSKNDKKREINHRFMKKKKKRKRILCCYGADILLNANFRFCLPLFLSSFFFLMWHDNFSQKFILVQHLVKFLSRKKFINTI